MDKLLQELSKPFPLDKIKQREGFKQGELIDYVAWTEVVHRLNEVCGSYWKTQATSTFDVDSGTATVEIHLSIMIENEIWITRSGEGADKSKDSDKALKTAHAEAFKKAANMFGIGLELWEEDHRENLQEQRNDKKKNLGVVSELKDQIYEIVCTAEGTVLSKIDFISFVKENFDDAATDAELEDEIWLNSFKDYMLNTYDSKGNRDE